MRPDHEQSIGFFPVGGNLRQKFVRGDACGSGELRLVANLASNGLRRFGRRRNSGQLLSHVEVGLIERERLDERRVTMKNVADLSRYNAIFLEVRSDEYSLRTETPRATRRHRRMHSEFSRLV